MADPSPTLVQSSDVPALGVPGPTGHEPTKLQAPPDAYRTCCGRIQIGPTDT
jgi:hypothetical protein